MRAGPSAAAYSKHLGVSAGADNSGGVGHDTVRLQLREGQLLVRRLAEGDVEGHRLYRCKGSSDAVPQVVRIAPGKRMLGRLRQRFAVEGCHQPHALPQEVAAAAVAWDNALSAHHKNLQHAIPVPTCDEMLPKTAAVMVVGGGWYHQAHDVLQHLQKMHNGLLGQPNSPASSLPAGTSCSRRVLKSENQSAVAHSMVEAGACDCTGT